MRTRSRRAMRPVPCPQPSCDRQLGYTDGRRIYVGAPQPTAMLTQQVTICCARPGCRGCLTWHPPRDPDPPVP